MIARPENFLVRPLFYDALSGDFEPATDPHRFHTLGRLAMGTVLKGRFIMDDEKGRMAPKYQYSPSWASHVTTTVWGEFIAPGVVEMESIGLDVDDNPGRGVWISDGMLDERQTLWIGQDGVESSHHYYELALGNKLHIARRAVTAVARSIFSQPDHKRY